MIKKSAVLTRGGGEIVRRLSDDVLAIAQAAAHLGISDTGYERLIDAGLAQKGAQICSPILTYTLLPSLSCTRAYLLESYG